MQKRNFRIQSLFMISALMLGWHNSPANDSAGISLKDVNNQEIRRSIGSEKIPTAEEIHRMLQGKRLVRRLIGNTLDIDYPNVWIYLRYRSPVSYQGRCTVHPSTMQCQLSASGSGGVEARRYWLTFHADGVKVKQFSGNHAVAVVCRTCVYQERDWYFTWPR